MPEFYEFFAGAGMARLGLGEDWTCTFANDIDEKKAASYRRRFGDGQLRVADVSRLREDDLPGQAALAWASFPCQDLSLAGNGEGLTGKRSGAFWPFWNLMRGLHDAGRAPGMIVLENVCGAISSNNGEDFAAIAKAIVRIGYRFGAMVMDAVHFLPQSRPRLFIVAVASGVRLPEGITRADPNAFWHPRNLVGAKFRLTERLQDHWIWWSLPAPAERRTVFADLIEDKPAGVIWRTPDETQALLRSMSLLNREKVLAAQKEGVLRIGALYKRMRNGVCRAEARFDDVAGCLRAPRGGSSRQTIILVHGQTVRTRLLSPREAARLMGLPEDYRLPKRYNEAYHLIGDGLAVPVVSYLERNLLTPLAQAIVEHPQAKTA
ncbi:MAG: DNA cytosine methyltransferase [Desulfovibrionaceae bacterium]|nr:DNA cytosine methyltransferase [Desulfovibrionaceae bacterium]MBF0512592.1 DNA cytosine methyltransferase [Desulfovibrionaceae bacterium]